jgi:hypothetical protein
VAFKNDCVAVDVVDDDDDNDDDDGLVPKGKVRTPQKPPPSVRHIPDHMAYGALGTLRNVDVDIPPMIASSIRSKLLADFCLVCRLVREKSNIGVVVQTVVDNDDDEDVGEGVRGVVVSSVVTVENNSIIIVELRCDDDDSDNNSAFFLLGDAILIHDEGEEECCAPAPIFVVGVKNALTEGARITIVNSSNFIIIRLDR